MPKGTLNARLIYPPHPTLSWRPERLGELKDYWAQYKYDDWRTLVYFTPGFAPGKGIHLYSRHKAPLRRYVPPEEMLQELASLKLAQDSFHVLDGGLLHHKTARIKNTLILWDILVHNGQTLHGTTYAERYELLRSLLHHPKRHVLLDKVPVALRATKHLWLAPVLKGDYATLFSRVADIPEIEGLVLKDPLAPLRRAQRSQNNARWLIRVRKPRQDYAY